MTFSYNEDEEIKKDLTIFVTASDGVKCQRCRNYHYVRDNYDDLCDRCCNVILDHHPGHNKEVTAGILKSYKLQRDKWNITTSDKLKNLEEAYLG